MKIYYSINMEEINKQEYKKMRTQKIESNFLYHYENALDNFIYHNKPAEAIRELKKVIRLNPGYAQAYYDLGYIYSLIENPESAKKYYQGYLKLSPYAKDHDEVRKIVNLLTYKTDYH